MGPKRLVLFVEGQGDRSAVPVLIKRLLTERNAWDCVTPDAAPFETGGVQNITGRKAGNWTRWLRAALKRPRAAAVLLILDGDRESVHNEATNRNEPFCAADVAKRLAAQAREAGAGNVFSVACVFARQEFESWLLAGIDSLRGQPLPDGRPGVASTAPDVEGDTDGSPRDAKGWLSRHLPNGYKETVDQELLTAMVSLESIRKRSPRSFRRLEHAMDELCEALRTGQHIASPVSESPAP